MDTLKSLLGMSLMPFWIRQWTLFQAFGTSLAWMKILFHLKRLPR